jgi:hypothetical protein
MHLEYLIHKKENRLIIFADTEARVEISELESPDSDEALGDAFEWLIANSVLEWVGPWETGDLTDAPMLGSRNGNGEITDRWAFMEYQIESVLGRLLRTGKAVFIS